MVRPGTPRRWGGYTCCCCSNPAREAKTGVGGQGPDGLVLRSVGGIRAGDWERPGRILQSRTVGPIFNFICRGNFATNSSQEDIWRCICGEGVWEGRHVRRVPLGMSRFLEPHTRVHSSGIAFRVVDQ